MTQHTAAEMRQFAEWYEARVSDGYVPYRSTYQLTAAMLRQAADAMEAKPEYLCNATRFKLSFSSKGNVSCLSNWRHELDGKWVALVDAINGKHLTPPKDTP